MMIMKKTIAQMIFAAVVMSILSVQLAGRLSAAEPDKTGCAEGPTIAGPVNTDCPVVERPRFRLR